ncbi:MAG: LysM peptidoglycan-binding domain-containing protein [Chloroflexi bacterium]|nr:LysM peptidoglycan-binding domain-containing protein [Chloroflexota bacterium]
MATPEPTAASTKTAVAPLEGEYYTVQSGDSLSAIAQKTGVSEQAIMNANNMGNADVIVAGQKLLIPGWTGSIAAAPSVPNPQPTTPPNRRSPPPPLAQICCPTAPLKKIGISSRVCLSGSCPTAGPCLWMKAPIIRAAAAVSSGQRFAC